ncbi:MAG: TIGR04211 family SH3 domain-containing protein [Gammaproteobacteria bacterium]
MFLKNLKLCILLLSAIATSSSALAITSTDSDKNPIPAKMYITDVFEVTLRSGTSTSNEILMLLKSGQAVTLLEQDSVSQYSLVKAENGKQGYVLSRYLVDTPSAKQRLASLQQETAAQKQENQSLKSEISILQTDLANLLLSNENLKNSLQTSEDELERVSMAAESTLEVIETNRTMEATIAKLQQQQSLLADENAVLKDSTRMDWFIRGAAVSLVAFLIGILVTRIRWKKQDSWGAY